jgi:drug/metabolite transporter (DMT)-like permease
MEGVFYAITAGVTFGVFQSVNRLALRGADPYRTTFRLLQVGTSAIVVWAAITQDLNLLFQGSWLSIMSFAAAGIIHFYLGWTFLSLSQQRIGATETSAVVAMNPLVATLLAAWALGESVTWLAGAGVVAVSGGVVVLSLRRGELSGLRRLPLFGLGAALCWGSSPLFIRWGLAGIPAPMIGVGVGLLAATLMYAVTLAVVRTRATSQAAELPKTRPAVVWILLAGVLVAIAISLQWMAFDLIAIAVAITLLQLSVPTVIVLAPVLIGSPVERPTPRLLVGAAAVVSGSILVVLAGTQ